MHAVEVTEDIYWVGAIDWELRDFHGYETPNGSTYNAYLVRGEERTALIDTVKEPFVDEMLSRVSEVMDPADIDLIVVNHVEPDHNSGLPQVMAACPDARVIASGSGVRGVAEYHGGLQVDGVGAEDVEDLGGLTLHFMPMPMVHWPDSMFTWCPERATLMPNDAFGQHYASSERFADEVGLEEALEELAIYFANILMPLIPQVGKAVGKLADHDWVPEIVAPSHGVIWRGEALQAAMHEYGRWTSGETKDRVTIAYSTMWGSTRALAHAIADGATEAGADTRVFDLADSRVADVTHHLLESKALLLGSPTLHHGMLYRMAGYLTYLEGLKPADRMGAIFGSYGWSGGAEKRMREHMESIGFEMAEADFRVKYRPTEEDLEAARAWARELVGPLVGS